MGWGTNVSQMSLMPTVEGRAANTTDNVGVINAKTNRVAFYRQHCV